jgi:LmbE family N-acetylglucosaminyl deacetylase
VKRLSLAEPGEKLSILCLGAHSDDIEIGLGAVLLDLAASGVILEVRWCVASAADARGREAENSAMDFLSGAVGAKLELAEFDDTYFPAQSREIKEWLLGIRTSFNPDIVFTHRGDDAHQDHREISTLTWNVFRDHMILEYEIPKWDGDLGRPNVYFPVSNAAMTRKIELLQRHFSTQRSKDWFDEETFTGLARLRGMECRAPERYAEAFIARKLVLG